MPKSVAETIRDLREAGYDHNVIPFSPGKPYRYGASVWLENRPSVQFLFRGNDIRTMFEEIRARVLDTHEARTTVQERNKS